jgi:hypothetical protein
MHIRYVYLLSGLLAYLAAAPIAVQYLPQADFVLVDLLLVLVLVAGVRSLLGFRWIFRIGVTLAVAWVTLEVVYVFSQVESLVIMVLLVALVFVALVGFIAMRDVLYGGEVDQNRLMGAVCVYLLLGLAWAYVFTLIHIVSPTSFEGIAGPTTEAHTKAIQFLYYSFVTLTTLGYGEITPASPVAQTLAYMEAVSGQFYLTILVAALVGMLLSRRQSGKESRS